MSAELEKTPVLPFLFDSISLRISLRRYQTDNIMWKGGIKQIYVWLEVGLGSRDDNQTYPRSIIFQIWNFHISMWRKEFWKILINLLKGVVSKNLQKPYICGRGGYNSWGDGS